MSIISRPAVSRSGRAFGIMPRQCHEWKFTLLRRFAGRPKRIEHTRSNGHYRWGPPVGPTWGNRSQGLVERFAFSTPRVARRDAFIEFSSRLRAPVEVGPAKNWGPLFGSALKPSLDKTTSFKHGTILVLATGLISPARNSGHQGHGGDNSQPH